MNATKQNLKSRCGNYHVHHVGAQSYWVVCDSKILASFRNLSEAHNYASRCHHADRHCAAHAISLDDPAALHNAIKNAVGE